MAKKVVIEIEIREKLNRCEELLKIIRQLEQEELEQLVAQIERLANKEDK